MKHPVNDTNPILLPGPTIPPKPSFLTSITNHVSPLPLPPSLPAAAASTTNGSEFDSPSPAEDGEPLAPLLDPKKCEVRAGKETTLEITKEKMGLGLSIVGGSDTPLVSWLDSFVP